MAGTKEGIAIMKTGTKKADASTSAIKNIEQIKSYPKRDNQSRPILRDLLGVLLLRLVTGQAEPEAWQIFDGLLRRFYAE
jgi:hypothetical protein